MPSTACGREVKNEQRHHAPYGCVSPVVNRRRGRLPASVAKLGRARALREITTNGRVSEPPHQTYSDRRKAAIATAMQGQDRGILETVDQLRAALMHVDNQLWEMQNALLHRVDPGLEAAGKAKGGKV